MLQKVTTLTLFFIYILPIIASAAFKLPDSGQTKCYQAVDPYAEIPCAGTGQDGAYSINPMSYTDNGDGTVTDNNTGFIWQKCSIGQNNDATCSGKVATYNWYQAFGTYDPTYNPGSQDVCGDLNPADWRLPSKKELLGIIDYSVPYPGPAIRQTYFPNTGASGYWSSTAGAGYPGYAWIVHFNFGHIGYSMYKNGYYVRCVRGGQLTQTLVDNGNGTVTDNRTGLTWQQGEPGARTWGAALSYCEGLSLGGRSDWRLPNVKELESLTDNSRYYPAIDASYFPNAHTSEYWTSTTLAGIPGYAWSFDFSDGNYYFGVKSYDVYVRCVCGVAFSYNLTAVKGSTGGGTVTFTPPGSVQALPYTGQYTPNSKVTLNANADSASEFGGWTGGGCSGKGDCVVTVSGDKTMTAIFNLLQAARIDETPPVYYSTITAAIGNEASGMTIEARDLEFLESLNISKTLILKGGFNLGYSSNSGKTTLKGTLTVTSGSLTVENVQIQ